MDGKAAAQLMGWAEFPVGWEFHEVMRNGELAGFFCTKENEVHAFRLPEFKGRWLTRQNIESLINPILAKYGDIKTVVTTSNVVGHEFVTRMGFTACGHDSQGTHYITKKVNHARF